MTHFFNIFLLGTRVILASLIGLCLQIALVVKAPDQLLSIQESVKTYAASLFRTINSDSQYQVAYNLIGGDNIVVHTFFVLIAYILILLLLLPFRKRERRIFS